MPIGLEICVLIFSFWTILLVVCVYLCCCCCFKGCCDFLTSCKCCKRGCCHFLTSCKCCKRDKKTTLTTAKAEENVYEAIAVISSVKLQGLKSVPPIDPTFMSHASNHCFQATGGEKSSSKNGGSGFTDSNLKQYQNKM
ncbi:uncharacterized protein LOC144807915 [Lissotriton helveticus]